MAMCDTVTVGKQKTNQNVAEALSVETIGTEKEKHMSQKFAVNDLLNFEKLIAPTIIKIVYFIGLALIALGVAFSVFGGLAMMSYSFATGLGSVVVAVLGGALGVLMWRILMEVYITFFGIYDRLGEVRDRLPPK